MSFCRPICRTTAHHSPRPSLAPSFLTWVCTWKSPSQRHELASHTSSTHAHLQPRLQSGIFHTFDPNHSLDTPPPLPRQSSLSQGMPHPSLPKHLHTASPKIPSVPATLHRAQIQRTIMHTSETGSAPRLPPFPQPMHHILAHRLGSWACVSHHTSLQHQQPACILTYLELERPMCSFLPCKMCHCCWLHRRRRRRHRRRWLT